MGDDLYGRSTACSPLTIPEQISTRGESEIAQRAELDVYSRLLSRIQDLLKLETDSIIEVRGFGLGRRENIIGEVMEVGETILGKGSNNLIGLCSELGKRGDLDLLDLGSRLLAAADIVEATKKKQKRDGLGLISKVESDVKALGCSVFKVIREREASQSTEAMKSQLNNLSVRLQGRGACGSW